MCQQISISLLSCVDYNTGEESAEQIYDRAIRLGFGDLTSLYVMTETKDEVIPDLSGL